MAEKIIKPNEIGQESALKALCFISRKDALITEFAEAGVIEPILRFLNSKDPLFRVYAAEIIKNFTANQTLNIIDKVDVINVIIIF